MGKYGNIIYIFLYIVFLLSHDSFLVNGSTASTTKSTMFTTRVCETHIKPGDIMLGGSFPVYRSAKNNPCNGGVQEYAISLVESMIYALDLVNKRNDILSNVTLGYEIRNDCGHEDITLWTMLTMVGPNKNAVYAESCPEYVRQDTGQRISAVIGPGLSTTSLLAAKVGRVYAVPIVSFAATSDELSDADRFPFFFRTVPPDKFQVGAIIDILRRYDWKYIALFYSIDTYGIHGARQIQSLAEQYDICIAINMPLSSDSSTNEENDILDKLKSHDKVTVVVLFTLSTPGRKVLRVAKEISNRKFTFIGSDSWGPDKEDYSDLLPDGALFVRFVKVHLSEFEDYYSQLPSNAGHTSPWYRSYLIQNAADHNCTDSARCRPLTPHPIAKRIIDGVFALAYALDASLRQQEEGGGSCENSNGSSCEDATINGWTIKDNLQRVSFPTGLNETFQFDENGDVLGRYEIQNWKSDKDGVYQMTKVGLWDPAKVLKPLRLNEDSIDWGTDDGDVPRSLCIEDCKPGYISIPLKKKCCLGCQQCPQYAIVIRLNESSTAAPATCHECPVTHWPDDTFTRCVRIEPSYVSYNSLVFLISSAGAGIGLVLTGISAIGLCYYSEHGLIKASSRELSAINIAGLAFSCLVVLLIMLKPATITCVIVDVCITTCVCMIFAPVLLKVNRIWRIFNATKGKRPLYTSSQHQLSIAAMLIIVEVTLFFTRMDAFLSYFKFVILCLI